MKWRSAVVTAAWVAVGTAAGALGAWSLAGSDGAESHSRPLDDTAVRQALAAADAGTTPPSPDGRQDGPGQTPHGDGTPTPAPSGGGDTQGGDPNGTDSRDESDSQGGDTASARRSTVHFTGGTATAECRADGTVFLVAWSPADGYKLDDVERGPALQARVEAEQSDDAEEEAESEAEKNGTEAADVPDIAYAITCGGGETGPHAKRVFQEG